MTLTGITRIVRQTLICQRLYGFRTAFTFISVNLLRKWGSRRQRIYRLDPNGLKHPLHLRGGRSDFFVFSQIFADDEFAPLRQYQQDISTIVDLGGNIGLASVWFLNVFPRARIVTVEANPQNHSSLEANLKPYGNRVTIVKGGIWKRRTRLSVVLTENEAGAQVRETVPGDDPAESIEGWDMPALMELAGLSKIDLLKIDIEGAEAELLSHATDRWLPHVRNLSIELHGPECEAALNRVLASYTYQRHTRGELIFCMGLQPKHVSV